MRMDIPRQRHRVLVVIPCLNESRFIGNLLQQLLATADELPVRIVVADGGSTDATREIVGTVADEDPRVVLLRNPARFQSAGINLAVALFGDEADYLVRIDAHSAYPSSYCHKLVEEAGATGADSVVVGMRTVGMTCFQRAVAAAQNSWLGTGGSGHRTRAVPGYVDHGHHALMRISAFRAAGGYDETFTHNEDAELDLRLREKGFRIWLTDRVGLVYFPRDTVGALFRQYRNYGRGRARTQLKHRARPRIRQMLPALVLPAATAALLAAPVGIVQGEPGWTVVATPALGWIAACGLGGLALAAMRGERCAVFAGPAAAVMHLAWSTGFWSGLLRPGLSR